MATILRLAIQERTSDELALRASLSGQPLELVASRLLEQAERDTRDLPPGARTLQISGASLETLERILGGGSLLNQGDLEKKVARLAGISFLHVRLPFTPNQLDALAEKAQRNSLTVEQLVERTAPRIYEHFFDLVART